MAIDLEKRRKRERLRQRKLREDPEYRKKQDLRKKEWIKKNSKRHSLTNSKSRDKRRETNREAYYTARRENYKRNSGSIGERKRRLYHKKSPTSLIRRFVRGEIGYDEFNQRLRQSFVRYDGCAAKE